MSADTMTLYNLNKWPVGFANPESENDEKPFKDFVEAQVKDKYYPTENGLPPKEGVTVDASMPNSAVSYSLISLSGSTLNVQTGCASEPTETTVAPAAAAPAGSAPAPAAKAPSSCEQQLKVSQELLAYVLDEGREFQGPKDCKLVQAGEKAACAVCGDAKDVKACPGFSATGAPAAPADAGAVVTDANKLPAGVQEALKKQGMDLTCIGALKVDFAPGTFSDKGGKLDLSVTLKKTPVASPAAAPGTSPTGTPSVKPPSLYFSIVLYPVKLKDKVKPESAKFEDWVPVSASAALWRKYCINPDGFGSSDAPKKGACTELKAGHPLYTALSQSMKDGTQVKLPSLDFKGSLQITVTGMKGKLPTAAVKPSTKSDDFNEEEFKRQQFPSAPTRESASVGSDSVQTVPYSSIDYGEEVASALLFAEAAGTPSSGTKAPAAAPKSGGSGFNYYKFTSSDKTANPVQSFNVGFGQAVAVKVFIHQWFDRTPTSQTKPSTATTPPKTERVYCSSPIIWDSKQPQKPPWERGFTPAKPYSLTGLEEFKKTETPQPTVPQRRQAAGPAGGSAPGGGSGYRGGGQRNGGGSQVLASLACTQLGFAAGCQSASKCSDYNTEKKCDLSSGKLSSSGSGVCCNTKKTAYVAPTYNCEGNQPQSTCKSPCVWTTSSQRCVANTANSHGYQSDCIRSSRGPCTPDRCNQGEFQMRGDNGVCCVWVPTGSCHNPPWAQSR